MNVNLIPRKHRRYIVDVIEEFRRQKIFLTLDEYLRYLWLGATDGWMLTNNKKFQAIKWLIEMKNLIEEMDKRK